MRELTCIVCPIGCSLLVEEGQGDSQDKSQDNSQNNSVPNNSVPVLEITGNRCKRGTVYAREEIHAPKRVVTATCGITFPAGNASGETRSLRSLTAPRRIPVKTSAPCPKEKIGELLDDIYRLKPGLPVEAGDRVITDWKGSGIDVVVVRSLE